MTTGDGTNIEFQGFSHEAYVMGEELDFDPPMIELAVNPDGFAYFWKQIQKIFKLPNPNMFPPLRQGTLPEEDRVRVYRYLQTTRDLASSSFLGNQAEVRLSIDRTGTRSVEAVNFPSREVFVGFPTLFRQVYSENEPASFERIFRIVGRVNVAIADSFTERRQCELKQWKMAQNKLKGQSLSQLLGLQLETEGSWDSAYTPRLHDLNPQQLISLYFSGDIMHWGDNRGQLAAFKGDRDISAAREIDYMSALAAITHIYLGFSVVIQSAFSGFAIASTTQD